MTYNFDPERWYDIERRHLEQQRAAGLLSERRFSAAFTALQEQYEHMMDRLNSVMGFSGKDGFSNPRKKK
jgi:hypothetical protein